MNTQTTNERSGNMGRPMLVWRCRTCGKVAYDSAAQILLSQQRSKKPEQPTRKEQPMTIETNVEPTETIVTMEDSELAARYTARTMTEAELEARWNALQQARELRDRRADLTTKLLAMQQAVAQLETDIAFATRKALAQ